MKSGKRYAMPVCKSNRYLKSFLPSAVQLLNKSKTCQWCHCLLVCVVCHAGLCMDYVGEQGLFILFLYLYFF